MNRVMVRNISWSIFSASSLEIILVWFHSWGSIYAGNQFLHFEPNFFASLAFASEHSQSCQLFMRNRFELPFA